MQNIGNLIRKVKNLFFSLASVHNSKSVERGEGNARGFNREHINNEEQISKFITYLCKEIGRGKVGKNGLLKATLGYIGLDINRSPKTVRKYLDILQRLGFVKSVEVGLYNFGKKWVQCLYITIDWALFALEQATERVSPLPTAQLKTETPPKQLEKFSKTAPSIVQRT
jgi:hypothetical protein